MHTGKITELYPRASIASEELDRTRQHIRSHADYLSADHMIELYRQLDLSVVPDPYDRKITGLIVRALRDGKPLSVIRLGDGEFNILSFGQFDTPQLDRYCFAALIEIQEDAFLPTDAWMVGVREMMLSAVLQADIVGVLGLWRPWRMDVETYLDYFDRDPRGITGQWRGLDYALRLARSRVFAGKILASAHLYLGVLHHFKEIVAQAPRILLLTNKSDILDMMRRSFPGKTIELLPVGETRNSPEPLPDSPKFLAKVAADMPQGLCGYCCLVGAGPWAEIYCAWIKQRGGVAVDIGSAFDLLAGQAIRPIHKLLGLEKDNPYRL